LGVIGVDLSQELLAFAKLKMPTGMTVRLAHAGAAELSDHFPTESFDTIVRHPHV
jgi:ubiquinone/menaquinone biosynthesis C-methylase UbiE